MKEYRYNLDDAEFLNSYGEKLSWCVPELCYQEHAVWRIFLRTRDDLPRDLTGIVAWSAAVDCDFKVDSPPMCRALPEDISADPTAGAVTVRLDAGTAEFLAAVGGSPGRNAYFELYGLNSAGERAIYLCFKIRARMAIDPDPEVDVHTPDTLATKTYTQLAISGALASAHADAREVAREEIGSGGYVTSSGAQTIASGAAASAASGAIFSGAEIDTQIGDYRITATSGGGVTVSGLGASVTLSGGQIAASATDGEDRKAHVTITSGGIDVGVGDPTNTAGVAIADGVVAVNTTEFNVVNGIIVNDRPVLTALATSTDSEATSASFDELAGGTSYIYTQPLTSLGIGSVASAGSGRIRFTLAPGGSVAVSPEVTVYDGGSAWAYGQYLLEIENGAIVVHSGGGDLPLDGVAGVFVKSGAITVSGAMTMSGTAVGSGVTQYVYPLGAISATSVGSGGSLALYGLGGRATDVFVSPGGVFDVAEPENDFDPAEFSVIAGSATQIAEGTLRYGGEPFTGYASDGGFHNLSGTYRLGIGSGVSALSPLIGNSDTQKARIYAFSGAYVSGAHIGISGDINVYPGGMVEDTTLGGYAGERFQCELTVWGGSASGAVVSNNAFLNVLSGGQMLGTTTVCSGGSMRVRLGSTYAENVHLQAGATFSAHANASVGTLRLSSGCTAHVSGGATVGTLKVSGGTAWLRSGSASAVTLGPGLGAASRPTVSASAANIGALTVSTYGAATLYSGTTVTNLQQQGGYVIARGARISGGRIEGSDFQVSSGTTATSLTAVVGQFVVPKKKIVVFNGGGVSGLAVDDQIQAGETFIVSTHYGVVSVMSGGRLENTEFTNIVVSGGGVVDGVTPKRIWGGFAGSLVVKSGGTALNVVSSAGWTIVVEQGGSITYAQED